MYTRHHEVPVFETRSVQIEANLFNQAKLVLKSFPQGLRFAIPGLKTLEWILQSDEWIIVDSALNDVPVAAWLDFETQHRDNLHLPINCHLRLFHAHAGLVLKRAQQVMLEKLAEILKSTHR